MSDPIQEYADGCPVHDILRGSLEGYCDYCEKEGHNFSHCPARDDEEDK